MPELPEVEVNTRNLRRWTEGRRIVSVQPPPGRREMGGLSPRELTRRLSGRRVVEISRRGKWILGHLDGGAGLALHLGMTGKLVRVAREAPLPRFTRAVLGLDDGHRVCFVDSRRFGRVYADGWEALRTRREIAEVGPDALSELDAKTLGARLARTVRPVKDALMDQRVAGGVGNIYATEALWRARIHPSTPAHVIGADPARSRGLVTAIRAALRHGLADLAREEVPTYVEEGADNPFRIYDRAGEACPRCGGTIQALTIAGRTSAFCPACQPGPRRRQRRRA